MRDGDLDLAAALGLGAQRELGPGLDLEVAALGLGLECEPAALARLAVRAERHQLGRQARAELHGRGVRDDDALVRLGIEIVQATDAELAGHGGIVGHPGHHARPVGGCAEVRVGDQPTAAEVARGQLDMIVHRRGDHGAGRVRVDARGDVAGGRTRRDGTDEQARHPCGGRLLVRALLLELREPALPVVLERLTDRALRDGGPAAHHAPLDHLGAGQLEGEVEIVGALGELDGAAEGAVADHLRPVVTAARREEKQGSESHRGPDAAMARPRGWPHACEGESP